MTYNLKIAFPFLLCVFATACNNNKNQKEMKRCYRDMNLRTSISLDYDLLELLHPSQL